MELLFLSCTLIFWLCPSGDFVPRYRCWPTWQHCSSSSELRNFFRICLNVDVSISYFPQQHGHFQRTDFKDNSSFFVSGVFSSVLILDTFFFSSHLLILYLGTSFICVCLLYSSFYLWLFSFVCLFPFCVWFMCVCVCVCNSLSSLNFILIYELVLYSPPPLVFMSFLGSEIFLLFLVYWVMFARLTFSFRHFVVSHFEGTTHLFLVFPFPPRLPLLSGRIFHLF